ncbi:MAG: histidinol-phosphate transaminase [Zetaproteobacteria bacterium]|nr:histidinol-phosphate transaminase [Zetaproteobacteria bacterium]
MTTECWLARAVPQAQHLIPYVPGKPIETLLREKGLSHAIKLASNENPFGPPPKAIQAFKNSAEHLHLYPDGDAIRLKQAIAQHHKILPSQIVVGNGSNEVLELIIRTFAGAGDEVIYSQKAFIVYALATTASGATGIAVPDTAMLGHDLCAMADAITEKTKIICIANPNNPTGTLLGNDEIQAMLNRIPEHIIVLLDEAYTQFVTESIGDSVAKLSHPGLVISRTFSKAYGLAGCRVGYAIMDASVVSVVNRFREPFNVNLPAQEAAIAALHDGAWVEDKVRYILEARQKLENELERLGVLGGQSYANFVLLKHPEAACLVNKLEDIGIIVRPLAGYGMVDFLRITVGTEIENLHLVQALASILPTLSTAA